MNQGRKFLPPYCWGCAHEADVTPQLAEHASHVNHLKNHAEHGDHANHSKNHAKNHEALKDDGSERGECRIWVQCCRIEGECRI